MRTTEELAVKDFCIRVGGESGEGVVTLGTLVAQLLAKAGMEILTFRTYPAEIKGGPVMYQIRAADSEILSHGDAPDILIALDEDAWLRHRNDLREDGVLIYDVTRYEPEDFHGTSYGIPLTLRTKREVGFAKSKNVLILGILGNLLSIPSDFIKGTVEATLKRKPDLLEKNLVALLAGEGYVAENLSYWQGERYLTETETRQIISKKKERLILTGNQAIAIGAIAAGLKFYAGYPITPATDILEFLSRYLPSFGGRALQVEDEIAAISAVLGASMAGVKAMTATSGPGLSLMTETLGLISMLELPAVIVNSQRGGPSTGLPTKTQQADLYHAVFGSHGDSPRIVLAPMDIKDCFYQTVNAFNLAEKYQVPVIVLSDQALSHRVQTLEHFKLKDLKIDDRLQPTSEELEDYKRYLVTESGVSPISIPGGPGVYNSGGIEHNEYGAPDISPENHTRMMEKRFRKISKLPEEGSYVTVGNSKPDIGIFAWGSVSGAVHEATKRLVNQGVNVGAFFPKRLHPLPYKAILAFADSCSQLMTIEANFRGQLASLLSMECGLKTTKFNYYGGIPVTSAEICTFCERNT
ncbi:MAG: 2-oxoacid:acceptor oxidoreductase subunit alpha [Candidatus Hodarchaeales archaeon]